MKDLEADHNFDSGRQKLWEVRDELDHLMYRCYRLWQDFAKIGLIPPSEELRELAEKLSLIKSKVTEAESAMAREFYDREESHL